MRTWRCPRRSRLAVHARMKAFHRDLLGRLVRRCFDVRLRAVLTEDALRLVAREDAQALVGAVNATSRAEQDAAYRLCRAAPHPTRSRATLMTRQPAPWKTVCTCLNDLGVTSKPSRREALRVRQDDAEELVQVREPRGEAHLQLLARVDTLRRGSEGPHAAAPECRRNHDGQVALEA